VSIINTMRHETAVEEIILHLQFFLIRFIQHDKDPPSIDFHSFFLIVRRLIIIAYYFFCFSLRLSPSYLLDSHRNEQKRDFSCRKNAGNVSLFSTVCKNEVKKFLWHHIIIHFSRLLFF
jgi:hypothetical protein